MKNQFCTGVSCMDGRVHLPVINYLKNRFSVEYVDLITEPGPNLILANQTDSGLVNSILARIHISVAKHSSVGIAVMGHHDCAGNPGTEEEQLSHTRKSLEFLSKHYENVEVAGLWVDENFEVHEVL